MNEYHLIASNDHLAWQSGSNNKDRFNLVNKSRNATLPWRPPAGLSLAAATITACSNAMVDASNVRATVDLASVVGGCRVTFEGYRHEQTYEFKLMASCGGRQILDVDFVPGYLREVFCCREVLETLNGGFHYGGSPRGEAYRDQGLIKESHKSYTVKAESFKGITKFTDLIRTGYSVGKSFGSSPSNIARLAFNSLISQAPSRMFTHMPKLSASLCDYTPCMPLYVMEFRIEMLCMAARCVLRYMDTDVEQLMKYEHKYDMSDSRVKKWMDLVEYCAQMLSWRREGEDLEVSVGKFREWFTKRGGFLRS